ncbi:ATP-dependent DNA helicase [Crassaminicella thermophila]|uniref:ATP-dependent DNA helicase n=1 Tax=Crassaminicella thermophila TaxID=2599308 RepID=A0A5C0SAN5_CRATE|nr:ATP-dependent DNA helicase [Crassaminicella thermophila]QEK11643.1 ATP-dependent DNA helicase [Crassaminicella thermophila]
MDTKHKVKISIRDLVEFILRSGNISTNFSGSSRAVEGTKAHKKIQKASKEKYEAEVTLKLSLDYKDFILEVGGRADGVICDNGVVTIDEIKTTVAPLEIIDENFNHLHWAQAKCYAYIYAKQYELDSINIRLTYYQLDTEEIKYIDKTFTFEELRVFFYDITDKYSVWAKMILDWKAKRDASIKRLEFPYKAYRKGQRELAVAVYKTIANGKKLYAQAPTGIGKTISTIFPSIKAVGEGLTSKIFYLTAKTITRTAAQDAFELMRENGLEFKTITLTAKEKICFCDETNCNPDTCEYARGHFDRVNDAIMDILKNSNELTRETIERYSRKYNVCPFEYSLDLTSWADAVICDYNYLFDPNVSLKRFFSDTGGDYTFLIDEAHNLVDRSREMFSAELYKKPILELKKATRDKKPKLSKALDKINKFMLKMKKNCNELYYISKESPDGIYGLLMKFIKEAEECLLREKELEEYEELLQLYFDVLMFIKILELYDERYITYVEKINNDVKIKLFCIDPSYLLSEVLKKGKATVFFSATLIPMNYYHNILGGKEDDKFIRLDSPFDVNNRCLLIAGGVSTKYRQREMSYSHIVSFIGRVIEEQKGNYLVFFPSYKYMNAVYEMFNKEYPDINTYIQEPSMTEYEREDFLKLFKPNPKSNTLGFCVLGGIYSEGIDLKDDRLVGTIIVGVGLPQMCLERDIIKDYFQDKNNMGYEYSYMYPGMNKVLQAAGRVIRSETDKGVILLIDERFTYSSYKKLFPKEWFPYINVNENNIGRCINAFWNKK